jgi:hypothetical protein
MKYEDFLKKMDECNPLNLINTLFKTDIKLPLFRTFDMFSTFSLYKLYEQEQRILQLEKILNENNSKNNR